MSSGVATDGAMEAELEMTRLCLGIGSGGAGNEGRTLATEARRAGKQPATAARRGKQPATAAGCARRKKQLLNVEQEELLEWNFRRHAILPNGTKQDLARELRLQPEKVGVWFQNRRARSKLKRTELELELLRHHCHRLTAQNAQLRQQIAEAYWRAAAATAGPSSGGAAKVIIELD